MNEVRKKRPGCLRTGCTVVAIVVAIGLVAIASTVGVAVNQNRSAEFEIDRRQTALPDRVTSPEHIDAAPATPATSALAAPDEPSTRLVVHVSVGQLALVPGERGRPIEIDGAYDPDDYVLTHEASREGGRTVHHVSLVPRGSVHWALFRAKLASEFPIVRVAVPPDVAVDIDGEIDRGYAAVELGGLNVRQADFRSRDGGVTVSIVEPTARPMERLSVLGGKGMVQITSLGNGSPRETVVKQDVGALEVDLRGAWLNDGDVRLSSGGFAGGSVWLPRNVTVEGVRSLRRDSGERPEIPRPTVRVELPTGSKKFIVID